MVDHAQRFRGEGFDSLASREKIPMHEEWKSPGESRETAYFRAGPETRCQES